jgi:hypothetical protein
MKRKHPKPHRTHVRDELDDLFKLAIRKLKGHKCEHCGKTKYLNVHHYYTRKSRSVRWNLMNGFLLCVGCHTMSSTFSAHQTPADFVDWAVKDRGSLWAYSLRKLHNVPILWETEEMEALGGELYEWLHVEEVGNIDLP